MKVVCAPSSAGVCDAQGAPCANTSAGTVANAREPPSKRRVRGTRTTPASTDSFQLVRSATLRLARDLHGRSAAERRAIAELALAVVAPAIRRAAGRQSAGVIEARTQRGEAEASRDRHR